MIPTLSDFIQELNMLANPGQRLYWPFLLSSMAILILWSRLKGHDLKKDLTSASSILDLKLLILNTGLKVFIFPFFFFTTFEASLGILKTLLILIPNFTPLNLGATEASLLATLLAFVVNDFFRFFHHYLMHRLPLLRVLHRTHHSALVLTPLTLFRSHPFEALIAGFRNILSVGLTLSLISFLFQRPLAAWDILGVNLFGFLFNALLANLRHSPMPIGLGPLEYIFISPRMHQIHHSNNPKHFGKNYGVALALWDQIVGSFYRPNQEELNTLTFGLYNELNASALEEATTLQGTLGLNNLLKTLGRLLPHSLRLKTVVK